MRAIVRKSYILQPGWGAFAGHHMPSRDCRRLFMRGCMLAAVTGYRAAEMAGQQCSKVMGKGWRCHAAALQHTNRANMAVAMVALTGQLARVLLRLPAACVSRCRWARQVASAVCCLPAQELVVGLLIAG